MRIARPIELLRTARLFPALAITLFVCLCGCASTPPVEEYLDLRTGATIHRVGTPYLLARSAPRTSKSRNEWAQIAPLVVNRAGQYSLYLWVELPKDVHERAFQLIVDEQPVSLEMATNNRRSIAIGEDVYANHSTFGTVAYYKLSDEQLTRIARASKIRIDDGEPRGQLESLENQRHIQDTFVQLYDSTDLASR